MVLIERGIEPTEDQKRVAEEWLRGMGFHGPLPRLAWLIADECAKAVEAYKIEIELLERGKL